MAADREEEDVENGSGWVLPNWHAPLADRCLSAGFTAFVAMVRDRYLAYAQARLQSETAGRMAVETALRQTQERWPTVLQGPRPAEDAWYVLRAAVTALRAEGPIPDGADALHRILPDATADAAVLRHQIGLTPTAAADLMGVDPSTVEAGLLMADRLLSACPSSPAGDAVPRS